MNENTMQYNACLNIDRVVNTM